MNKDDDFELWWRGEDDSFRDNIRKKDAKRIWNAAYRAGGHRPWWTITQEQWAVLNKKIGGGK